MHQSVSQVMVTLVVVTFTVPICFFVIASVSILFGVFSLYLIAFLLRTEKFAKVYWLCVCALCICCFYFPCLILFLRSVVLENCNIMVKSLVLSQNGLYPESCVFPLRRTSVCFSYEGVDGTSDGAGAWCMVRLLGVYVDETNSWFLLVQSVSYFQESSLFVGSLKIIAQQSFL